MDTLSSLFSKNFKKDPALLQFYGINEDLYEGKKLISKRRKTKNKIAKTSSLVEGFANQLDDLTISEDQETSNLNAELQRNLSSYGREYRNVMSDYLVASREAGQCTARCNNKYQVSEGGECLSRNAPVGPSNTNPKTVAVGDAYSCSSTPVNTQDAGWSDRFSVKVQNNNMVVTRTDGGGGAGGWGQDLVLSCKYGSGCGSENPTEVNTKKQSCLAGCGLAKAYLEPTNITGSFNNETISECGTLAPNPTACEPCAYMHWYWSRATQEQQCGAQGPCCKFNESFWSNTCNPTGVGSWCPNPPCSDSTEGANRLEACENSKNTAQQALDSGMEGRNLTQEYSNLKGEYLSSDQCNEQDVTGCSTCESCYSQGPGYWCADTQTCSTHGNPCTGNCSSQCTNGNVAGCTTCESCYSQGPGYWCSDTGRCSTHGNPCTGGCGQGGYQSTPESTNVLLENSGSIDSRIKDILGSRQHIKTTNNNERQNLVNTLNIYTDALKNLKKKEQGVSTLTAMTEDGNLKRNSANLKYYIWLGLAICGLIIVLRKLKK